MKTYPNVERFLESIADVAAIEGLITEDMTIFRNLIRAVMMDGITIAPNVVLSLDEAEDILRNLVNKAHPSTCHCEEAKNSCECTHEPAAPGDHKVTGPDQSTEESAEDPAECDDACCESSEEESEEEYEEEYEEKTEINFDVFPFKQVFFNNIDFTRQSDGTIHFTIEDIEFHQ